VNVSNVKQVSATGDVTTVTTVLRQVVLTGGSDAATATVKAGGSGGTTVLTVKAAANTTAAVHCDGATCAGGVHVTLAGTGPVATFVYA
jgi:hypothetical protein